MILPLKKIPRLPSSCNKSATQSHQWARMLSQTSSLLERCRLSITLSTALTISISQLDASSHVWLVIKRRQFAPRVRRDWTSLNPLASERVQLETTRMKIMFASHVLIHANAVKTVQTNVIHVYLIPPHHGLSQTLDVASRHALLKLTQRNRQGSVNHALATVIGA